MNDDDEATQVFLEHLERMQDYDWTVHDVRLAVLMGEEIKKVLPPDMPNDAMVSDHLSEEELRGCWDRAVARLAAASN